MAIVPALVLALMLVIVLSACGQTSGSGYPAHYREALQTQTGVAPVPDPYIDAFVALFEGDHGPETAARAAALYAEDVYFSDTLTNTRSRDVVIGHFERLAGAGTRIDLEVHERIQRGADVYLVWSMGARFEAASRAIESDTIGISHLRFNDAGQIILQQDFWDAAHGFYQHLPVLGAAVRGVSSGFDES
jgi:hypothetical protein